MTAPARRRRPLVIVAEVRGRGHGSVIQIHRRRSSRAARLLEGAGAGVLVLVTIAALFAAIGLIERADVWAGVAVAVAAGGGCYQALTRLGGRHGR